MRENLENRPTLTFVQPLLARSAVAVAAVVAAGALIAASVRGEPSASPSVTLSGASAPQKALMREILAGMGRTLITRISITPPPKSLGDWPRAATYVNVIAGGGPKGAGEWQSWLFKGAFGDFSLKRHLPPMFRFIPLAAPPPATAAGATALAASVRQAVSDTAGKSGVQVASLQILRPDGLAVALVLQVSDPASYMKNELLSLLQRVRGGKPELDGTYLALEDSSGSVVWNAYQSARMGSGSDFARSDLAGCNPIIHFGPDGYSLPSCPA
jgi:hypothetical protein